MKWLELSTIVDPETAEAVSELFARYGYNQGVVIEQPVAFSDDGCEGSVDPFRPVEVKTYLIADEEARGKRSRIEESLWHLGLLRPIPPLQVVEKTEEDWANAWKKFYEVQRIGRRVVIVPSWQTYEPKPEDVVLQLDPGMAFGTGLHPTTRLCLQLLEEMLKSDSCVLDLGTGSGILAIAAAKLGAKEILALDIDPVAVDVARANVALNLVSDVVQVHQGTSGDPTSGRMAHQDGTGSGQRQLAGFDLVVANISANTIISLSPALAGALRPGGSLIASGIIEDRLAQVLDALNEARLDLVEVRRETDWVALHLRRSS
ncbi:MAG: 50S ribosomal protein L11 methyltransferase [Chloroflexi bacterium]|nr:50S ribosomal protein L11 methyltransferase [Chloroflexota bacterium]